MRHIKTIKHDKDKTITLVEDETFHTRYIQKELKFYDKLLYQTLQKEKIAHIPKIYVIQEKNNILTLLEEYIPGDTLENKCFSKQEVQHIMHQLCMCLNTLHHLDPPIIHRDIKPENIIYHNKKITLIDFGIARFENTSKSKDTLILGSVGYAAPEQFGFAQSNPQTDIYALGKLMNYISNGSLENQDFISKDYKHIISKATQLDYKNRYQSVRDMDLALQGKYIIYPCINNETKKSKFISLVWILFMLWISIDLEPTSTFKHNTINQICAFLFMYFGLFLCYNKYFFQKFFPKLPWPLLYLLIYILFLFVEIAFFMFIDSII